MLKTSPPAEGSKEGTKVSGARAAARRVLLGVYGVQNVLAHEWAQCLRNHDGAVCLLVVLQNGHEPAGGRQGAVERSGVLGLAVLIAVARGQAAGLEGCLLYTSPSPRD